MILTPAYIWTNQRCNIDL